MEPFARIYARAAKRKGGEQELEKLLPKVRSAKQLSNIPDDRFLAEMTACVFRAGFSWQVIENKWPNFERAFAGFDPRKCARLSDEALEKLAADASIVRNFMKIKTVRANAVFITDIQKEHGSFAKFVADWPATDIVGLRDLLKKRASRLGGNSGLYFLRGMGKDTFLLSKDVTGYLIHQGVVKKDPSSKRDWAAVQDAFGTWQQESGRPFAHISRIIACSFDA